MNLLAVHGDIIYMKADDNIKGTYSFEWACARTTSYANKSSF